MASIYTSFVSSNSITVYVGDLNSTWWSNWGGSNGAYTSVTISCNGSSYSVGQGGSTGTSATASFYGLTAATSYYVSATVYYKTSSGDSQNTTLTANISTSYNPQPAMPYLSVAASRFTNTATISVSGSATVVVLYGGIQINSVWSGGSMVSFNYALNGAGTYYFQAYTYDGTASPSSSAYSGAQVTLYDPVAPSANISTVPQESAANDDPALALSWSWSDSNFGGYFSKYNIYNGSTLYTSIYSISTTSLRIPNLAYNATASFRVEVVVSSGGNSLSAVSNMVTGSTPSAPVAPTNVTASNAQGSTSISVSWSSIYTTNTTFYIEYKTSDASSWSNISASNSTRTATISGLTYGKTYNVRVGILRNGSYSSYTSGNNVIIARSRPSLFAWSSGYSPVSNGAFNIKASDWNALIQNIKDVYLYKNNANSTRTYTLAVNTGADSLVGRGLSATMYNEVANGIGEMNYSGLPSTYSDVGVASGSKTVSSGYPIYANMIDGLRTAINGVQ